MILSLNINRQFNVLKVLITFIFNISVKTNYWKLIVFKNLLWFLTGLVSFITILESQSYKIFISEFKWIRNEKRGIRKFEWILNFDSLLTWMITDAVCSAMRSMISWSVNFFLLLLITFGTNVPMSIIPSPCSLFFALHLEWSLNLSTDKKWNAICIFANLCSTFFSLWFKFSSARFYFLSKCTKKRAKANREKFKCR